MQDVTGSRDGPEQKLNMKNLKKLIFLILFIMHPIDAYAQVINKIVAVVNEEVVTQQDVDQMLSVLYAQYVHDYKGDELLRRMEDVRKNILQQIIEDKLILSRARELNVMVREDEINTKLEYVKGTFPAEEEFYDLLEAQGITIADLKKRYMDQIMMKKVVDLEIKSKISILPSEIKRYYQVNRREFMVGEKFKVRHILLKAGDDMELELAKVEIEDIYNKLQDGRDFAELAAQYSEGPNKEQGGDMGYIERGEMIDEIDDAMSRLEPGEFSDPIKSSIGYHILKVEDIQNFGYLTLEEAQEDIKKMLFQKKIKEKLEEWLGELRSKAYISIK